MPFKMYKIIFFSRKNKNKKIYVCLPYLKFSDPLPEKQLFFYLASLINKGLIHRSVWIGGCGWVYLISVFHPVSLSSLSLKLSVAQNATSLR